MAPKRAVTQSLQVLGSAWRLVSAWREVPGELSDSLSPKLETPKAGPVPDTGLKDRFLSPPEAASPPSHLCRLRPHARFSGKCSPTISGAGPGKEMKSTSVQNPTISVCTGSAWAADVVSTDCSSSFSPLFPWHLLRTMAVRDKAESAPA